MVASNLIVHGNLDAALKLLLVVGRADEACRHLQDAKRCGGPSFLLCRFFSCVVICSDFGVCCVVLFCCSVLFFYTVHSTVSVVLCTSSSYCW